MNRIAIFSDVHGNLPALKTVLTDINNRAVDQVYCLGDLVDFAPWTNEVIDAVRHARIPCILGNHDQRIAFDEPVTRLKKHGEAEAEARIAAIEFTKDTIGGQQREYLSTLPLTIKLTFTVGRKLTNILLVHASERGNDDYVYEDHDRNDLLQRMHAAGADYMIMGHTHLSYIRQLAGGKYAINAGSVGRTKERKPQATYLLLHVTADGIIPELVRLDYPVAETVSAIRDSGIPDFYAEFLTTPTDG